MGDQENLTENELLARRWCEQRGHGWQVIGQLGIGATAPVFEINTPDGPQALKLYNVEFSEGDKGEIESKRIDQLRELKGHDCPFLVQIYEAGSFEDRFYVLMSRAPGCELEKVLMDVPRNKVRQIVDQIARAALFLESRGLCHRDIKSANVYVSDDFEQATLLDLSVLRDIRDSVGIGTDRDGQLPVVGTARYSPPEYLFRLLEPSSELWHALNVYQLGGLLHDLIMKKSLFQPEFEKSSLNRYRFAWLVATQVPEVKATDVEQDLVVTAQRALDKDWVQRSTLKLGDFLADTIVRQKHALHLLGLGEAISAVQTKDVSERLSRIRDVSNIVKEGVVEWLRSNNATCEHTLEHGEDDFSKRLVFRWHSSISGADSVAEIHMQVVLTLKSEYGQFWFVGSVTLFATIDGTLREASLPLPTVIDEQGVESNIINQVGALVPMLAIEFTQPQTQVSGD